MASRNEAPGPRRALHFTFVLMLFCWTGLSASRLALSLDALGLGAGPFAVALLYTTLYAFPLLLSWPIGVWGDRLGSRWLLLFGSLTGMLAMLLPWWSLDLGTLYAAGALVGLSFSFYNVLLQNMVGILSPPEARARNFGNASMVAASTNFIGPMFAGAMVDRTGPALASAAAGMPALVAAVLLLVFGGILPGRTHAHDSARPPQRIELRGAIVRMLVLSALVQLGQDLYQLYLPIHGHAVGLSGSQIGAVLAAFAMAGFAARMLMPGALRHVGEEALLAGSFFVAAAGLVALPAFGDALALAIVSFVVGIGMGCGQPITTMLTFSQSTTGRSGEVLGMRQSVNNAVRMAAPPAFGAVASLAGVAVVFWLAALVMGAGGWAIARSAKSGRR